MNKQKTKNYYAHQIAPQAPVAKKPNSVRYSPNNSPNFLRSVYASVAETVRKLSDFIEANPRIDAKTIAECNEQLREIFECISILGDAYNRLEYAQYVLERKIS